MVSDLPHKPLPAAPRKGLRLWLGLCAGLSLIAAAAVPAQAISLVYDATKYVRTDNSTDNSTVASFSQTLPDGTQGRAASAAFEGFLYEGAWSLRITLSSIGGEVSCPEEVLTAVFFDLLDNVALVPGEVVLADGSVVWFDPDGQPDEGVVSGEWGYWLRNGDLPPPSADQGVSSVGIDLVGPHDMFDGLNLSGPVGPDGLQYGLLSKDDDVTLGNAAVTGKEGRGGEDPFPLVQHSVVITLYDLPMLPKFDVGSGVSNVQFWYGTDRVPIPEPLTMLGVCLGVCGLGGYLRKRLTKL